MEQSSTDRRVRKTKKQLRLALMELLAERRLEPVIICESAGTQAEDARTMAEMYGRANPLRQR